MKFTIPADALADAAVFVSGSINSRPPNPILSGILIEAAQGMLRLSGFDYERFAQAQVAADVETPGHVLLSARMFTDIIRKFKTKPLTVNMAGDKVELVAGSARYTLQSMPIADYPELPGLPADAGTVDAELLGAAIREVVAAASDDAALPIIMAVKLSATGGALTLRATDRYRGGESTIPWAGTDFEATPPASWLADVAKNISGETHILISETSIGVRSGNRATAVNMIGGDYPKVERLFPDDTPIVVTVDRAELLDVVNRISTVVERDTPIRFTITDGQILVDAGTGENAQGMEVVSAELEGNPITVAFSPPRLIWTLSTIPGARFRLAFTEPAKPAIFTSGDGDHATTPRHLIMPIRLPEGK